MEKKIRPQDRYDKKSMATINTKYRKEFVEEFKEACNYLNKSQSEIIREAMIKTIDEAKLSKKAKGE